MNETNIFKPIYATTNTITQHLKKLGVPASVLGYGYLKHGIYYALNDTTLMHSVTTRLYPMIAKDYDTTPQRVERAIRHAIELSFNGAYFDGDRAKIVDEYFGNTISAKRGKTTNSEFIASVAEKIRMDTLVDAEARATEMEAMRLGQM